MAPTTSATKPDATRILTIALFVTYDLVLVGIILFKFPFSFDETGGRRILNLIPLTGSFSRYGVKGYGQLVENVLIFVPLGIYLGMVKVGWAFWKKTLLILGVTVAFEVIQYVFAIGRADITDVLANLLGGILGIGIYALLAKALRSRTNGVINVVALVATVAALLELGFLLVHAR